MNLAALRGQELPGGLALLLSSHLSGSSHCMLGTVIDIAHFPDEETKAQKD